jgi:cell division protein FtsI (penicillin-binding protein 3)
MLLRARVRFGFVVMLFTLCFAVVAWRLTDLGYFQHEPRNAGTVRAPHQAAPFPRADIVDRNGVLLATSLPTSSAYADPARVLDPVEAADKLLTVLPDLDRNRLIKSLGGKGRFVWIRRNLTPRQTYRINALGIPGLYFKDGFRRVYPAGEILSHVVGFTSIDNIGLYGIERSFDERLRSDPDPLQLSIDLRVQHVLRAELAAAIEEFDAIGGAGLVMNAKTGEVLALSSLPDFDPHRPGDFGSEELFNRVTLGVYEMGSTFKILNTAMALDSGAVKIGDSFDATEPIKVGRFRINDFHPERRWLTVPEIMVYSSNIGAARMALAAGTEAQRDFMRRAGLLDRSPIELPEVGAPLVPSPWREINTMTIAFGHGLAVSGLQLVSAIGAVVNDGLLLPPTLIKRDPYALPEGRRIVTPETSDTLRRLLRLVITKGTGKAADVPGYLVGGKTGTAEKRTGGSYDRNARISSFVGVFPMTDPEYLVFVMLDEPKGTEETFGYATAGWVAAPAVGKIIAQIGPLVGMKPIDQSAPKVLEAMRIDYDPRTETEDRLP